MQSQRPTAKHTFEGHKNVISSFVFLHDNVHIVSGSEDGTMRKWDCDTGLPVGKPWKGKGGKILALALSPDGKTIACGRGDGSVVQRDTDGKTIRSIWRSGHGNPVQLVSWSPSGDHIASVSHGTILIRNADSDRGDVNVSPIETKHWGWVYSLSYSPSGDRVASGGNTTICIWDSNTGELLVGPMEDMGHEVMSAVWSPDGSKLYSASDQFVRVFDSTSGELLHRFEHSNWLLSVALSLQHNILACVGLDGVAHLWDTESYQPLGDPFSQENNGTSVCCVSFSRDGRYLAYGGYDKKITLWMVEDITPQLPVRVPVSESQGVSQLENQPELPSSPCLDINAPKPFARPGVDDIIQEGIENPCDNHDFFRSSQSSLTPTPLRPSPKHRIWDIFFIPSVFRPPLDEHSRLQERLKRCFSTHRAPSSPVRALGNKKTTERSSNRKFGSGDKDKDDLDCSASIASVAAEPSDDKCSQREESITDTKNPPSDELYPPPDFNSDDNRKLWKLLTRARWKDTASGKKAPTKMRHNRSPDVVKAHADGMSQAALPSHAGPAHTHTSSQVMAGQSSEPSRPHAAYDPSRRSQRYHPSLARHVWNTLIPSRHDLPANESIPLQSRFKRSLFSQPTGPRPVTVYPARPKKLYWMAPHTAPPVNQGVEQVNGNENPNAQTVVPDSAAQPDSGLHRLQSTQEQGATQLAEGDYDYGCWGNFCLAFWCIRRPVGPAAPPPAL